jgi:hypothetical protein
MIPSQNNSSRTSIQDSRPQQQDPKPEHQRVASLRTTHAATFQSKHEKYKVEEQNWGISTQAPVCKRELNKAGGGKKA